MTTLRHRVDPAAVPPVKAAPLPPFSAELLQGLSPEGMTTLAVRTRLAAVEKIERGRYHWKPEFAARLEQIRQELWRRSRPRASRPMQVYVIRAGDRVKIGASRNPPKRLASLQTASSERLELLFVMDGDTGTERDLHDRFERYRIGGEWFRIAGHLARFIERRRRP